MSQDQTESLIPKGEDAPQLDTSALNNEKVVSESRTDNHSERGSDDLPSDPKEKHQAGVSSPETLVEEKDNAEPAESVKKKKLEKVATTNRQVTSTGKKLLSFLWLPLVSDKVRNNVKNRWTLLAAYANATALVLLVLVILFTNNEVSPDKLGWSVPPAQYFELGVPIPPFSVRLVDGFNNPISGRTFYFSMSLISPYTRTVRLTDSETASSRPVSCLNTMLYTADPFRDEDLSFCMPQASEVFLANRSAVTDHDGTATFDNAVLGIGAAGASYLLIITPETDDPNLIVYTYAQAIGAVYSIEQLTVINQYGGRLAYRTPYTFDVEAVVGTSGTVPRMATAQVMAANMQTQFGLRGLGYSKAVPAGRMYSGVDIASFNYTNIGVGIHYSNMTEDNKVWRIVIRFKDVMLLGTNHRQMYFSLALWGTSIPLLTLPTVSEYMFPQKVYMIPNLFWSAGPPLNLPTALHFPTVRELILYKKSDKSKTPLQMFDKVIEGEELILSVKITSTSGSNRVPYFVGIEASHNLTAVSSNFEVEGSPFHRAKEVNSKTIAAQTTNTLGESEWEWFFSFTGNIGLYDVSVAVDGSDQPWSALSEYSHFKGMNTVDKRIPLTLDVVSSVQYYTVGENKAPWVQPPNVVTVGEAWQKVPFIIVMREVMENGALTNVSVPGKRMRINPRNNSEEIGIHVESQAGDQNGIINPVSIKVLFAIEEGDYIFDLYVDDLLVGSITKFVKYPKVAPEYCVPSFGRIPSIGWAGVVVEIEMFAKDYKGRPLAGALMLFSIDTGVSFNDATFQNTTDAKGVYLWRDMATGLSAWMAAPFTLVCQKEQSNTPFNPIANQLLEASEPQTALMIIPIQPRYKGLKAANTTEDGSRVTLEFDLEWSQVNASQPVYIGQTMNWQPRYVQNFWGSGERRGLPPGMRYDPPIRYIGAHNITRREDALISLNGTGYQPGFYLLSISVDFTKFGITPQVNMPPLVTKLTLTRSLFVLGNTFEQNKPFTYPPEVTLESVLSEGRHLVAQLGCRPAGSTGNFSWIWPQETAAYNGTSPQDDAIATTDINGLATFSALNIRSLRVDLEYTFRYCAAIEMIEADAETQTLSPGSKSYCVSENQTFGLSDFVNPVQKVITVTPKRVTITPGGPIPFLNVTITDTLGQPVEAGQFVFEAKVSAQQIAEGAGLNCYYFGTAEEIFDEAQQGFLTPCVTSINTPPGQYAVYAVGEGVRSNPVLVTVTDKVHSLDLQIGQFATNSNFSLGYTIPVSVKATTVTDDPSPNKAIELSIAGVEGADEKKSPTYQLKSGSLVTGQTDKRGIAILPISFQSAPTGVFTITAKVQAPGSNAALQQAVSSGLSDVAFKFGASSETLHDFVNPAFFAILQILNKLAEAPLAQSSATGILDKVSSNFEGLTLNSVLDGTSSLKSRVAASASEVYNGLTEVRASPTEFKIQNPVHKLKVLEQNEENWEVIATFGQVVTVFYKYTFSANTLKLQALDFYGNPVAYQQIDYATGTSNARIIIPQGKGSARVTDEEGMVSLEGLEVQVFASGDFSLTCSAQGGGQITIEKAFSFNVVTLPPATLMRYIAFILVGCYSPLLLASVPHSRMIYSILSITFTISVFVITIWFAVTTYQVTNSTLLSYYLVYAALVCSFMCLCNIIGITLDFVSKKKPSLRWMNDEGRAVKIMKYAQWITNVRIDKQMAEKLEKEKNKGPEKGVKGLVSKVSGVQDSLRGGLAEKMEKLGLEELEEIVPGKKDNRKKKQLERLPLERPDDVDPAASVPINYLIVVAITFVMAFALTLLMIFILTKIKEGLAVLLSYLPNPQAQANLGVANKLLVQTLSDGLPVFVRMFPQYSFLTNLIVPLKSIDIIAVLVAFRGFVEAFLLRLNVAFGIGIALGLIVVAATVIIILVNIKKMTVQARRGEIGGGLSLVPSEGYIGLHCFHFIIAHQLVAWGVILVALLLSVGPLVKFLYDQLLLIAVASIVSVIVQLLLNKILVGWFLTDGFTLLRPEGYAIWHFVGLILGIFTGLIQTVSRWGLGIGAFSGMFARLDVSIYPGPLLFLDKAHTGFMAVVVAEAKTSNPIFLVFNALLLKELHLRTVAQYPPHGNPQAEDPTKNNKRSTVRSDDENSRPLTNEFQEGNILAQVAVDDMHVATASSKYKESFFDPNPYSLSGVIVNLARVLARREASPGNSLDLWEVPVEPNLYLTTENYCPERRARRERVVNRFWLAVVLHFNPSLRKYRKHNLYHEGEDQEKAVPEVVSDLGGDPIA